MKRAHCYDREHRAREICDACTNYLFLPETASVQANLTKKHEAVLARVKLHLLSN